MPEIKEEKKVKDIFDPKLNVRFWTDEIAGSDSIPVEEVYRQFKERLVQELKGDIPHV